jgi:hypothetical protein
MSPRPVFFLNERAQDSANFIDKEEENSRLAKKTFTSERSKSPGTLRLRRSKEKILPLS